MRSHDSTIISPTVQWREFLITLGAGIAGLSGCVGNLLGSDDGVDKTIYVGAYHWGFVIVDESGEKQDHISLRRNDLLRVVSFILVEGAPIDDRSDPTC
ncbi:hypothetical protein [Halogranum amylolyticum]|uniref:hypothetical protein n=1 Tax=Halogranum amylolyticum TaxID=660520 RepID=UPI00147EFC5E|nr:hypothetical protein [Halogranum amylolyticum]